MASPRAAASPYSGGMDYPLWNDYAALALTVALVLVVFL
jgi:hypothetical protein